MSNQINTPEMAGLLQQAKDGLATPHQGQVVIQQIHIHLRGPEAEPQGLLEESFRSTVKWVLRPVGKVVKWGTAPVWFPLGMLFRDVVATPKRISRAFAEPWQQDFQALREDHEQWKAATPEERTAMVTQARAWLGIGVAFTLMALTVDGLWKWVPILLFLGLVVIRTAWCPVRHIMGLTQGGWLGLARHLWQTVQVVLKGGIFAYKAGRGAPADLEPKVEEEVSTEPAYVPMPTAASAWSGGVQ